MDHTVETSPWSNIATVSSQAGSIALSPCTAQSSQEQPNDSGYVSISCSPQTESPASQGKDHKVTLIGHGLQPCRSAKWGRQEVIVAKGPLAKATFNRFKDLGQLHGRNISELSSVSSEKGILGKRKRTTPRVSPSSLKLKALSSGGTHAQPWIIVFCDDSILKKLRTLFTSSFMRAAFQPSEADDKHPVFGILTQRVPWHCAAAKSTNSPHRLYYIATEQTLCGGLLRSAWSGHMRYATLGGVVCSVNEAGASRYYIMTINHALEPPTDYHDDSSTVEEVFSSSSARIGLGPSEEADDNIESGSAEGTDQHLEPSHEKTVSDQLIYVSKKLLKDDKPAGTPVRTAPGMTAKNSRVLPSKSFVTIKATSHDMDGNKPDLDWALLSADAQEVLQPNLVPGEKKLIRPQLKGPSKVAFDIDAAMPVLVLRSSNRAVSGVLSFEFSFFSADPSRPMATMYSLTLDQPNCKLIYRLVASRSC